MKYEIVKLHFKSPVHLGEKEGMMEDSNYIIHSDTLFSAICYTYRSLYGKNALETFLNQFIDNPPFLFSSAFPFFNDRLLFPIPLTFKPPGEDISASGKTSKDDLKSFKKLQLVPEELWNQICYGKPFKINGYEFVQDNKVLLQSDDIKELKEKRYSIWQEREIQRVSIDRISYVSNIFNFREIIFKKSCGLFFLIDFKNSSLYTKIKRVIELLGDEGIGGDRGSGKGVFKPEFGKFEVNINNEKQNNYLLLSLFFPSDRETKNIDSIYNFKIRGGFVFSLDNTTRRKKYVRMLTEGSVIKGMKPVGSLIDITPDNFKEHRVYRYGYAFAIPIGG